MDFLNILQEINTLEDGAQLNDDFCAILEADIIPASTPNETSSCAITAGLHLQNTDSRKKHRIVFDCYNAHLKSKLAIEQIKFVAGIKN